MSTNCLYSTVKNVSGGTKIFGFLPPHGRELADDEEFTIFGDIRNALGGNQGGERSVQKRAHDAFDAAIANGDLIIVNSPSVILEDTVTNVTRMLTRANGTLSSVAPCWD